MTTGVKSLLISNIDCISLDCSLKDDDSGDHDQDQGSPKDGEKEKNEDEEKEQNTSKKKVRPLKSYTDVCADCATIC